MTVAKRRLDPDRRSRIIDVALDVIAEHGVAGTTHRKVAEAADVPLGSMSYHFSGMDELLIEAFRRLAATVSARFTELLVAAQTPDEARQAVVAIITDTSWTNTRHLLLSYELYAFGARNPALQTVMRDWMEASRRALERHFDRDTARMLDALIEGLTIHRSVDPEPVDATRIRAIVDKLTA